jgi:hypothetical protein
MQRNKVCLTNRAFAAARGTISQANFQLLRVRFEKRLERAAPEFLMSATMLPIPAALQTEGAAHV